MEWIHFYGTRWMCFKVEQNWTIKNARRMKLNKYSEKPSLASDRKQYFLYSHRRMGPQSGPTSGRNLQPLQRANYGLNVPILCNRHDIVRGITANSNLLHISRVPCFSLLTQFPSVQLSVIAWQRRNEYKSNNYTNCKHSRSTLFLI